MLEPDRIRQIVRDAYVARQSGDKDALAKHFAPGATFRLAGDTSRLGNFPAGPADAVETVAALVAAVTFAALEPAQIVVDGQQAAIRYAVHAALVPSGHAFETEIADFLTFDDEGRITQLVEFADTGAIAHMAATGLL